MSLREGRAWMTFLTGWRLSRSQQKANRRANVSVVKSAPVLAGTAKGSLLMVWGENVGSLAW